MQTSDTDIVIIGGGILGLWLLNLVKQKGFDAILVEEKHIGGIQTINSQGIIHGGLKYALNGILSDTSKAISDMPKLWQSHLQGLKLPNLEQVKILSNYNYMWSQKSLLNSVANFLTSKILSSKICKLSKSEYPEPFKSYQIADQVYKLHEIVLDIPSLIKTLAKDLWPNIFKIDSLEILEKNNHIENIIITQNNNYAIIKAKKYIFTAGAGNQKFTMFNDLPKTQLRPLHMSLVSGNDLPILYAHCIEPSNKPRITITSHKANGKIIWYCGGQIAEKGITNSANQQVQFTKRELKTLFPFINTEKLIYKTFRINRAEPYNDNTMPTNSLYKHANNKIMAWPTKLALTPQVASNILSELKFSPTHKHNLQWPTCQVATPIWQTEFEHIGA